MLHKIVIPSPRKTSFQTIPQKSRIFFQVDNFSIAERLWGKKWNLSLASKISGKSINAGVRKSVELIRVLDAISCEWYIRRPLQNKTAEGNFTQNFGVMRFKVFEEQWKGIIEIQNLAYRIPPFDFYFLAVIDIFIATDNLLFVVIRLKLAWEITILLLNKQRATGSESSSRLPPWCLLNDRSYWYLCSLKGRNLPGEAWRHNHKTNKE